MLDSVKKKSDTSFTKKYRTAEFDMADYYVNRRDSSYCQVMKDNHGNIRQIIMAKKEIRFFTAEFYENGQLKGRLCFDKDGKLDGPGEYYFENGCAKSRGIFHHGLFSGDWKNFDEKGKLVSTERYDSNGQLIKTISKKN